MKKVILIVLIFSPIITRAITAELIIDTGSSTINALEATLHWPDNIRISAVSNADSAVLFWIKQSKDYTKSLPFSGITPGGFSGRQRVFVIDGDFSEVDLGSFYVSDSIAYANGDQGEAVPVTFSLQAVGLQPDTEAPDDFLPVVGRDQSLYEGRSFLSFATQDNGSGIGSYEVREGYLGKYVEAQSPYVLGHQGLHQSIFVKAVDNSGNERVVRIPAPSPIFNWVRFVLLGIIALLVPALWRRKNS